MKISVFGTGEVGTDVVEGDVDDEHVEAGHERRPRQDEQDEVGPRDSRRRRRRAASSTVPSATRAEAALKSRKNHMPVTVTSTRPATSGAISRVLK